MGAQALQQLFVVAGHYFFGNLRRQQAVVGLDLNLGLGMERGEQGSADQGEAQKLGNHRMGS